MAKILKSINSNKTNSPYPNIAATQKPKSYLFKKPTSGLNNIVFYPNRDFALQFKKSINPIKPEEIVNKKVTEGAIDGRSLIHTKGAFLPGQGGERIDLNNANRALLPIFKVLYDMKADNDDKGHNIIVVFSHKYGEPIINKMRDSLKQVFPNVKVVSYTGSDPAGDDRVCCQYGMDLNIPVISYDMFGKSGDREPVPQNQITVY